MNAFVGEIHRTSVAARLERLPMTSYQRMLFGVIATAWFFDSMDLGIMTFVLGSIKTEFGLSAAQTGLLASSSFVGMFLGAAIAGMLADRFGRKPVFQLSMIFWGVGSLMCGLSTSVSDVPRSPIARARSAANRAILAIPATLSLSVSSPGR